MNPNRTSPYLYAACQHGGEPVLKRALCEPTGPFRFAYSGRGFVTFKSQMAIPIWSRALPEHPMVRSRGIVLGKFEGAEAGPLIEQILEEVRGIDWQVLHVWQRDASPVGWRGFEPGQSELAVAVAEQVRASLRAVADMRPVMAHGMPEESGVGEANHATERQRILEIILDTPDRWWLATRSPQTRSDQWIGGVPDLTESDNAISRAYYKIAEAFAWSGLVLRKGEQVVEIGSSPGGACQWLLEAGARVTGIDPAEMDPRVLESSNFTHWRNRSLQIKRKAFRSFRVLVCDANVTPNYTLDTVEAIVNYPTTRLRALVLTMKLPEWEQADRIPEHLERVRSWGYESVAARQLAFNRREYCLVAKRRIRTPKDVIAQDPDLVETDPTSTS